MIFSVQVLANVFSKRSFAMPSALALALVSVAPVASAQTTPVQPEQYETPRGMGMGLGARASAASSSALHYNPANLALARVYHIESVAGYDVTGQRISLGGTIIDSFSSSLALGFGYRYILSAGPNAGYAGWEGKLGLAVPLGESFSIGVAGRYSNYWRDGQTPMDAQPAPTSEGITMDASMRATLFSGFHIAAIGQNLIDNGGPLVPRLVGGSVSWSIENVFTVAFDGFADCSTFRNADQSIRPQPQLGGSMELFLTSIAIRGGYYWDGGRQTHAVSGGLAYVDPSYSIDVAYRGIVTGGTDHSILGSIRYFVR